MMMIMTTTSKRTLTKITTTKTTATETTKTKTRKRFFLVLVILSKYFERLSGIIYFKILDDFFNLDNL